VSNGGPFAFIRLELTDFCGVIEVLAVLLAGAKHGRLAIQAEQRVEDNLSIDSR